MQHLEFCHQVLWPELDVQMVSVSEQWAQFSIAGPRSRDVLRKLVDDKHDLADKAFPYLAARELTVAGGIAARLFRLSFSGELAYELGGAGTLWRRRDPRHHGGGRGVRHRALRHRGARRDAHREGPCRRQRNQRADDRARSRPRPHDVGEEGLHRPRAWRSGRRWSRRTGRRSSASSRSIARRGCVRARISLPVGAAATIAKR